MLIFVFIVKSILIILITNLIFCLKCLSLFRAKKINLYKSENNTQIVKIFIKLFTFNTYKK